MIIAYFVIAAVLALVALGSGALKLLRPKAKLAEMGAPMAWTADFAEWQVKLVGAVEVLGAIGVILPFATGIVPVLSPIAAIGLALVHVGAFLVHIRRNERPYLNMAVFAVAGATAVLGFLVLGGA